jgi:hypothetical protein
MRQFFSPDVNEIKPSQERIFLSQGIPKGKRPSEKVIELCSRALDLYQEMAEPRGVFETISTGDFGRVYEGSGMNEKETPLKTIFPQARFLALMAFTLGETISQEITRLFDNNDFALGSMLDSVASEGADMATRVAERLFKRYLLEENHSQQSLTVLLYSPGYCGWHISAQKRLFEYLRPDEIDIALNTQFLMIPLKSVTGVLVAGDSDIHVFKNDYSFCRECNHHSCRIRMNELKRNKEIE